MLVYFVLYFFLHLFIYSIAMLFFVYTFTRFFYVYIDIVELVVVLKSDSEVYYMLMLQNIVTKEKKKYEDGDEMIKWERCQELEIGFIV